jgi:hypothetical protein
MRTIIFFLTFCVFACVANAQSGTSLEVTGMGDTNGYGFVRFTNASALGDKTPEKVKDEDISGSPYFDEQWNRAIIVLQNKEAVKVNKLKIDLYRNEVHYVDSLGIELVAISSVIKKVFVLDKKDSSKVKAVFQQIVGVDGNSATAFVQVLNNGKTALLKYTHVTVFDKGFDAIAGKNNYSFIAKATYCVLNKDVVTPIKSLDKSNVLAAVTPLAGTEGWLKDNKNKLKNETEIVNYFNYYNAAN